MLTLCIRYTLDPNRNGDFETYVADELPVIRRAGGQIVGYFMPTDFAGPTNTAYGLIEFETLAEYEQYRQALADDPQHRHNVDALVRSGATLNMERSFICRHHEAEAR